MKTEIVWQSHKGMNGKENKDFAGVAVRTDAILLMVLDGLSSSVNS